MNESVARIEAIIGRKVKRDIGQITEWAKGNLARAAEAIMNTPNAHVGIITGFYIQHAEPPSPETDGLGGMAHLAAGLANAGIPVTVITDTPCAKAVWAVVDALPMPVNLEVVSTTESSVRRLRQYLETGDQPITHLIAIERVSPASDGKPHREHGWDMSRETAPLHLLFSDPAAKRRWYTIGIGDGGNEIGMGSLPKEIIESGIPNGKVIAATTPVDSLIVAGVSNWGGYGLLAAMACTKPAFVRARDHDMGRISLFRVQRARDLFMSAREPFVSARHGADQFVSGSAWNALALHTQSNVSRIRAARGFTLGRRRSAPHSMPV